MFKTLKALLRRVDFYLRNEEYRSPDRDYVVTHSIDDLFDDVDDPVRTKVYWAVRRFWTNHWLCNPRGVYFDIKCAYQRVTRGWDDRAVWSVDYWLDDKMPAILRKLKKDKHGIPMDMFDGLPVNDEGFHAAPEMEIAEARWDEVIDKMIAAFEASRRVKDMDYEKELGDYPLRRPKGVDKETWSKVRHDYYLASEVLRKRDEAIFKEGMALFAEHYWSLWD
jgi:hypothetical protein